MEKVEKISTELAELDAIERVSNGRHSVAFSTNHGAYNSIPPEVLSVLAENGATLYDIDYKPRYDYLVVP